MTSEKHSVTVNLGSIDQIPLGEGRNFEVAGERVAVFRLRDGGVRATQALCPHKKGPLADGLVGGNAVICPLHAWKFNLQTGEAVFGDCGIKAYAVELDSGGNILLEWPVPEPVDALN